MADITINHVLSGTVKLDGNITGVIRGTEPVLETLNVRIDPSQAQTITPGTGVDGFNEVKVPQAMAINVSTDFVVAMGGSNYDTISAKNYIAVYDTSGRNVTRFTKGSGGGGVLSTGTSDEIIMSAYWKNTGIDEIVCPSVGLVGDGAFEEAGFKTVRLTNTGSVEIGNNAFKNSGLKDLYIHSNTVATLASSMTFNGTTGLTIHVPQSLLSSYQSTTPWNNVNCTWTAIE